MDQRHTATGTGAISIWSVDAFDDVSVASARLVLDDHERLRATRFRDDAARRRFVVTRGALRRLLGEATGSRPGDVQLVVRPDGKPTIGELGTGPVHFSISHAEDRALIALSRDVPVGIDLEATVTPVEDDLAGRVCTGAERTVLSSYAGDERRHQFLIYWVRKEAVAKADGRGLRLPFAALDVSTPGTVTGPGLASAAHVQDLDVGASHVAAVATIATGSLCHIDLRRWPSAEFVA